MASLGTGWMFASLLMRLPWCANSGAGTPPQLVVDTSVSNSTEAIFPNWQRQRGVSPL